MYEITVTRLKDGKKASAKATTPRMLLDHIEASAARNGFSVRRDYMESHLVGYEVGEVLRGEAIVASWEIGESK